MFVFCFFGEVQAQSPRHGRLVGQIEVTLVAIVCQLQRHLNHGVRSDLQQRVISFDDKYRFLRDTACLHLLDGALAKGVKAQHDLITASFFIAVKHKKKKELT
jgi:hypothetical protein